MKDSIHKKLTGHIRKTMGQYEMPYEPGSWEEFQRQQRKRQRRPLIWFRYALAACLLLGVLGVPVWLYVGPSDSAEVAVNHPKAGFSGRKAVRPSVNNHPLEKAVLPGQIATIDRSKMPLNQTDHKSVQENKEWPKAVHHQKQSQSKPSETRKVAVLDRRLKPQNKPTKTGFSQQSERFSSDRLAENHSNQPNELAIRPGFFEKIQARAIPLFWQNRRPLGLPLNIWKEEGKMAHTEPSKTVQKPIWGVSLAPQSVYAAGSSASVAVGGGVFSEIPLNRSFSLSTGLSMAQQKLGTVESAQIMVSTIPHLVSTNIRLTAVDLPLNIRFRPKKLANMGFYAEAGLSSVAFLNEQYAYQYEQEKAITVVVMGTNGQEQTTTQYVTTQETRSQSEPAFQKIYWGRIINLSIGVERRIGSQFCLSAEPYLKYPIGPFTRENLMLGSGGVSLRLGFQTGR